MGPNDDLCQPYPLIIRITLIFHEERTFENLEKGLKNLTPPKIASWDDVCMKNTHFSIFAGFAYFWAENPNQGGGQDLFKKTPRFQLKNQHGN